MQRELSNSLIILAAVLALGVFSLEVSAGAATPAARSPKPTITGYTQYPPVLIGYPGGPVTIAANVTNATSCELSSNVPLAGLPANIACSNGSVSQSVTVPPNSTKKSMRYRVTLVAREKGTEPASAKLFITVAPSILKDATKGYPPIYCPAPAANTVIGLYCNFSDAALSGLNLTGATWDDVTAEYADLSGSTLTSDNLEGSQFFDSDMASANFSNAKLNGSSLLDADLSGTDLAGANLNNVYSGGIVGIPSSLPPNFTLVGGCLIGPSSNLTYANLTGADLAGANLTNANLTDADLAGADLTGASLTDANLTNANLTDADLTDAQLTGINVTNADLTNANLSGVSSGDISGTPGELSANWQIIDGYLIGPGAYANGADLTRFSDDGVDLSGLVLTNAFLWEASMTNDNLTDADFFDSFVAVTLDDSNLTGVNFEGANLSEASLTNVVWSNTTCPDGSNSDNDGGTCANNLILPDAPTNVSAVPGDGQATVSWAAPDNGIAA
jgi:uncharacterized protein YjbI with pentapeptide repeats